MENEQATPEKLKSFIASFVSGKDSKLSNKAAIVLILLGGLTDLISLIPFAGDIVGPLFWIGVAFYLWKKGFGIFKVNRLAVEGIDLIAKIIPGIQELPVAIVGIIIVIILLRFEERSGISVRNGLNPNILNQAGVRRAELSAPPLNSGGVRAPQSSNVVGQPPPIPGSAPTTVSGPEAVPDSATSTVSRGIDSARRPNTF